jgi:hypothetical protein
MGRASAISHWDNIETFLTSMCDDGSFLSVSLADVALVESFLQVDDCDPWFTCNRLDNVFLARKGVGILHYNLVETSQIYNRTCFAILPYHEHRPSGRDHTVDGRHTTVFSSPGEYVVNDRFVTFGNPISAF